MFDFLFLDLDNTILDFDKAEQVAIPKTLAAFGVTVTQESLQRYHLINKNSWEMMGRGEIPRSIVGMHRFAAFFADQGIQADAWACEPLYQKNLAIGHYFLPGAEEAVKNLSKKYRLFLASNGTASVQEGRMTSANLYPYFEKVFNSQQIGANKPSNEYFDRCFAQIPDFDPQKAMIVGDSLTSDILGGIHAGIATCWVNPSHLPGREDIRPDFELEGIYQLEALLEQLKN